MQLDCIRDWVEDAVMLALSYSSYRNLNDPTLRQVPMEWATESKHHTSSTVGKSIWTDPSQQRY